MYLAWRVRRHQRTARAWAWSLWWRRRVSVQGAAWMALYTCGRHAPLVTRYAFFRALTPRPYIVARRERESRKFDSSFFLSAFVRARVAAFLSAERGDMLISKCPKEGPEKESCEWHILELLSGRGSVFEMGLFNLEPLCTCFTSKEFLVLGPKFNGKIIFAFCFVAFGRLDTWQYRNGLFITWYTRKYFLIPNALELDLLAGWLCVVYFKNNR